MNIRLSKTVRRITTLSQDGGRWQAETVYKKKRRKKRRTSRGLRPLEKASRRMARATRRAGSVYLRRHNKSARKKRNGWFRDMGYNLYRANRRGAKALKLPRWF